MAGAYSTDLREQMPTAVEAGATPEAAARRFVVARPAVGNGRRRPARPSRTARRPFSGSGVLGQG